MAGYSFDANKGETPETAARRRLYADLIMGKTLGNGAPKTIGDGIALLGNALNARWARSSADRIDQSGKPLGEAAYQRAIDAVTGGMGLPTPMPMTDAAGEVAATSPVTGDTFEPFISTVKDGGLTNPYGLAAVAATGRAESGWSAENANRTWSDPSESGKPGTAGGIMSWRGPRYQALAATGDLSPQGQARFFLQEDPSLVAALQNAKSVEEAQGLINKKWAFAGHDRPSPEVNRRLGYAKDYLPQFQGGTEVASLDPAAGMGAAQAIDAAATPSGGVDPSVAAQPTFDAGRFGPNINLAEMPPTRADIAPQIQQQTADLANQPALRPFRPGEKRNNADGSYSTELTTTWQLPDGSWVNAPSLWMGPNGPQEFDQNDEAGILGALQRYEAQNGQTFQRFGSPQEAEAAARQRSAGGGSGMGAQVSPPQQIAQTTAPQVAQTQPQSGLALKELLAAAANPWVNEQNRAVLNMLIEQEMKRQDPSSQLDMQYRQAQIDALNAKANAGPDADEWGLNPVWGKDKDGRTVLGQVSKTGKFKPLDTGDFQPTPGLDKIDTGTDFITRDSRTGEVISTTPKNNRQEAIDKAEGAAEGKSNAETKTEYDSITSKMPGLYSVVSRLEDLAEKATYTAIGKGVDWLNTQTGRKPREGAVARAEYTAIVDNQILPLLRDTFGAQFTNEEGLRLAKTLGDADKSPTEKQALLRAFIQQKERDIQALRYRMGRSAPDAPTTPKQGTRLRFNPQTGDFE